MIYIAVDVFNAMKEAFSTRLPECGGVLGADKAGIITEFYFDSHGICTPDSYTPDHVKINEMMERDWAPRGICMAGIVHSHGNAGAFPSCGDLFYCEQIMRAAGLAEFLLPVVTVAPFCLHAYAVRVVEGRIKVCVEEYALV